MRSSGMSRPGLESLSPIWFRGSDCAAFLQGQLSCDVRALSPTSARLGSLNSALGRVQAIVTLIEVEDAILALLPTATLSRTLPRLQTRILRSNVSLEPGRDDLTLIPLYAEDMLSFASASLAHPGDCVSIDGGTLLRWWSASERYLWIGPHSSRFPRGVSVSSDRLDPAPAEADWKRGEIASGIPQVLPKTYELFVAQMLNLEDLGAISFDKGCYTGQEVIARAHYRHTVTRRMYRFSSLGPPPAPATPILDSGHVVGAVVDSIEHERHCEILAVLDPERIHEALYLSTPAEPHLTHLPLAYAARSVPANRRREQKQVTLP